LHRKREKFFSFAICLILLLLSGCSGKKEEAPVLAEPVSVSVDTFEVKREDIYQLYTYDAQVVPIVSQVTAEKSGILEEFAVREGEAVKKGELIARLSDVAVGQQLDSLQEQIALMEEQNSLENEIAQYEIELKNLEYEELRGQGAESRQLELKKLEVEKAELLLRQQKERQALLLRWQREQEQELEAQLGECDILAPVSGNIVYLSGEAEGSMLSEGTVLAIIASDDQMQIRTDFVTDWYLTGYDACQILWNGELTEVMPLPYDRNDYVAAILRNGSFYSYFELEQMPEGIAVGDYAQLQIIRDRKEQVCVVPVTCLYHDDNGYYVYKIEEQGNRVKAPVAVGIRNELMVEITEGLSEGEKVYVKE